MGIKMKNKSTLQKPKLPKKRVKKYKSLGNAKMNKNQGGLDG